MPVATVNNHEGQDIQLKYYIDGPEHGEVVCLIMGLGGQSIHYPYNSFVAPLVAQGYRVLRFDNRDSGKSTILSNFPPTNIAWRNIKAMITGHPSETIINPQKPLQTTHVMVDLDQADYRITPGTRPRTMDLEEGGFKAPIPRRPRPSGFTSFIGLSRKLPVYDLADMACDVILLLDHLNIQKFHLVGVSMGGMISQLVAGLQPSRVLSLALVMTSTSNPKLQASTRFLFNTFIGRKPPTEKDTLDAWVNFTLETNQLIGRNVPDKTINNGMTPEQFARQYFRRKGRAEGIERQIEAIDTDMCRDVLVDYLAPRMNTLIFHGKDDQLVPTTNGLHMFEIMKQSIERSINPDLIHIPPQRRGSRRPSFSRSRRRSPSRSVSRQRRGSIDGETAIALAAVEAHEQQKAEEERRSRRFSFSRSRSRAASRSRSLERRDSSLAAGDDSARDVTLDSTTVSGAGGVAPTVTTTRRNSVTTLDPPLTATIHNHHMVEDPGRDVPQRIEEIMEILDGRLEVRTVIPPPNPYLSKNVHIPPQSNNETTTATTSITAAPARERGKQASLTLCLLDEAAHELCDYYCSFLVPQLLLHFDRSMNRRDIRLNEQPIVPQWGDNPDVLFGTSDCEKSPEDDSDEDDEDGVEDAHISTTTTTTTAVATPDVAKDNIPVNDVADEEETVVAVEQPVKQEVVPEEQPVKVDGDDVETVDKEAVKIDIQSEVPQQSTTSLEESDLVDSQAIASTEEGPEVKIDDDNGNEDSDANETSQTPE